MENILKLTYEEFLQLASDKSMKNLIIKENPPLTENMLWHKYLEYDNEAPFSNYSYGHGPGNRGANSMAKISVDVKLLSMQNKAKIKVLNFVKKIITTDEYKKIGPAMDHFGCFVRECTFEDEELMNDLVTFVERPDVTMEYKLIMQSRVSHILGSFVQFRELRDEKRSTVLWKELELEEASLYLKARKKGGARGVAGFLDEVYIKYKS